MKFHNVTLEEAVGGLLAHSHRVGGKRWSKGRRIEAEDIPALREEGLDCLTVAHLEPGDIGEDEAAERVAARLAGAGLKVAAPFTGRCNLFAEADGLLQLDEASIHAANAVDESVTVATLPPWASVRRGQMVATVKIIPFAARQDVIQRVGEHLPAASMQLAPYAARKVALILTRLPILKPSLLDKGEAAVASRIEALGGQLVHVARCEHAQAELQQALGAVLKAEEADLVLVMSASAITDREDVVPAAMVEAGARIERFGMPVDPGNLLLYARHGERDLVGLPGCARSPALNGVDWVLRRLFAGLPVDTNTIGRMGVGGLLQDTAQRPQARQRAAAAPARPKVAALILAAGQSRRMGSVNKLLADWQGVPLLRRTAENVLASEVRRTLLVTGHEAERVSESVADLPLVVLHNPHHREGMASSLRVGLAALSGQLDAVLICLGDMPTVRSETLNRLQSAYSEAEGRIICIPTYRGKRGNPVLLGQALFDELRGLEGDTGARRLIEHHADNICEVPVEDPGVLFDVDTPQALKEATATSL